MELDAASKCWYECMIQWSWSSMVHTSPYMSIHVHTFNSCQPNTQRKNPRLGHWPVAVTATFLDLAFDLGILVLDALPLTELVPPLPLAPLGGGGGGIDRLGGGGTGATGGAGGGAGGAGGAAAFGGAFGVGGGGGAFGGGGGTSCKVEICFSPQKWHSNPGNPPALIHGKGHVSSGGTNKKVRFSSGRPHLLRVKCIKFKDVQSIINALYSILGSVWLR